jgi:hypothetical protein
MKKILAVALLAAWGGLMLGTNALAAAHHHSTAQKTLVVAMHDPGCHWFFVHGKYTKRASVAGSVRVVNRDEATLKVASRHGMRLIPVGKSLVVHPGHYVVMMVGQAVDDNYLKLTVR